MIEKIPYDLIIEVVETVKMQRARQWPSHAPEIRVDYDLDETETAFRERCFEGTVRSYHYRGEKLELRKPDGIRETENDVVPMEIHIRFRIVDGKVRMIGHREASRYEALREHIQEIHFDWLSQKELREMVYETLE